MSIPTLAAAQQLLDEANDMSAGPWYDHSLYTGLAAKNIAMECSELDEEKAGGPTWTLFLMGPKEKDWGFLNENKDWVQWEQYLNIKQTEEFEG